MKKLFCAFVVLFCFFSTFTWAKERPMVLFDSELMAWLEGMAKPLLEEADINPKDVNIYVIKSPEVNAFVTPNKDIFFYSGLILKATHENEIRGVLAHEIGHIKGQHYLKTLANRDTQKVPIILGGILGAGAAALGSADGAIALLSGGLASAQDQALRHSRSHEAQADNIAAGLLNQTGHSTEGLISFFNKLRTSNLLYSRTPPAWLVTHPLPKQRISTMENHLRTEHVHQPFALSDANRFLRIQAKLEAFSQSEGYILRKYSYKNDEASLYARALAVAISGRTDEALEIAHSMVVPVTSQPFQNEFIALLYLDKGAYSKADTFFKQALEQNPQLGLIRLQMAHNLITLQQYDEAIESLFLVEHQHPTWSSVYRYLGIAYGKKNMLFDSHLYLAKEASVKEQSDNIKTHLALAEKYMEPQNKQQQERLKEAQESYSDLINN